MFGLLNGIALALSAIIVVGAGALGALSWFIAKSAPKSAEAMFAASLLLARMAIFDFVVRTNQPQPHARKRLSVHRSG